MQFLTMNLSPMAVALLSIHLSIPGCRSLKEKRSHLKPILARLHREFNLAAAEIDLQDKHSEAFIQCVALSTSSRELQSFLQKVVGYTEKSWPELEILEYKIENL